jgi:hypothetical protein
LSHPDGLRVDAYPCHATPFTEMVAGCFIRECLDRAKISFCRVPSIGYVQVGHPAVVVVADDKPSQISARGTGSAQELIKDLRPVFSDNILVEKSLEQKVPSLAIEIVAALDLILLNGDRNLQNLLVDEAGNLVLIDHSYTLPIGDAEFVIKGCWTACDVVKQLPSLALRRFVQMLDPFHLPTLARRLEATVRENLEKLPLQKRDNEEHFLGKDRILPHQIAVCFVKYCILEKNVSLLETAQMLSHPSINVVQKVYREINKESLPETLEIFLSRYFDVFFRV